MNKKSNFEIEQPFTNENGNQIRLPSDFYYDKYLFKDYKIRNDSGKLIVYAKIDYDASLDRFLKRVQSKSPDLLVNMLTLKDKLPIELFDDSTKILFCEKYITNNTINQIIKWCSINGFPFAIDNTLLKNSSKKTFFITKEDKEISFSISDFIYNLNEVYSAYQIYRLLTHRIEKINNHVYMKDLIGKKTNKINDLNDLSELSIDDCLKQFEYKYNNIQLQNQISFEKGLHFQIKANSLFDAAFFQLSLLLYDNEKELRICPLCKEYFEPEHANQKYCKSGTCYPQKEYKRKKSRKANKT